MHRHAALATLALAAFLCSAKTAFPQKTEDFAPKNGMYTLTFPAEEKVSQITKVFTVNDSKAAPSKGARPGKKAAASGQHKLPVEGMQGKIGDTTFVGASIGVPAVLIRNIPADERFDVIHEVIVKELKGSVKKDKDVKQGEIPGKEYQIELPKGVARMQLYTVAGWVIYVMVTAPDEDALKNEQVDKFFGSLKLTDKAQDVFRRTKR